MKGSTKAIFGEILSTFVSTVDDHKQIRATVLWDGKSLMADARDGYTLLAGKGRVEPWTWPVKDEAMIFRSTMGVDNYCNAVGDEPPDAKMFDFKRMQPCAVLYDMTAFSDPQVRKTLAGKSVALFTTIYVKETSPPVMSVGDDISEHFHTINSEGDKSPAKKLHMLHFIAIPLKTRPGMVREQQIDVYDTSSIVLGVNTWAPKGHPSKKTMPAEGKFMKNQKQPCVDQEIPPLTKLAYATDTLRVMRGSVKEYAKYKGSEIYTRMRNVLVKSEYFEHLRNEHLYCEREFILEDMSDFEETMRSQPERVPSHRARDDGDDKAAGPEHVVVDQEGADPGAHHLQRSAPDHRQEVRACRIQHVRQLSDAFAHGLPADETRSALQERSAFQVHQRARGQDQHAARLVCERPHAKHHARRAKDRP